MATESYRATIEHIDGAPLQRITLNVVGDYTFSAGQYLEVLAPQGISIPLSIASSPHELPILRLHYRSTPGVPEAQAMDALLLQPQIDVSPAAGDVSSGPLDKPLLLVVGGSGAAQAFSCAAYRAQHVQAAPTTIVWCADQEQDLYGLSELEGYGSLITIVDNQRTAANEGMVWLQTHGCDYLDNHVVLAGGPGFVYAATNVLLNIGFSEPQLQADVYAYAPRPQDPASPS